MLFCRKRATVSKVRVVVGALAEMAVAPTVMLFCRKSGVASRLRVTAEALAEKAADLSFMLRCRRSVSNGGSDGRRSSDENDSGVAAGEGAGWRRRQSAQPKRRHSAGLRGRARQPARRQPQAAAGRGGLGSSRRRLGLCRRHN